MIKYSKSGQFHQLLAAMSDKVNQATKLMLEAAKTFQKGEMFEGFKRTYIPFDEKGDRQPDEIKEMTTTVKEKLDYVTPFLAEAIDIQLSREASNASGLLKASLIVNDVDFGEFSSQSLLQLEKSIRDIRAHVVDHLPTLDMARPWTSNDSEHVGTYASQDEKTYRYVEETVPVVLYPHTDKHPAQVKESVRKSQVGEFSKRVVSGKITPSVKAEMMARVDALLVGIAEARSRANSNEATNVTVGKELLDYIFNA